MGGLMVTMGGLAMTAPLGGHAAAHSPRGLLLGVDTAHVLCMCAWLGGLVMLLVALIVAAHALRPESRTPLIATVVGRFSRTAMVVVPLLLLTGIVNSVVLVASFDALVETAYAQEPARVTAPPAVWAGRPDHRVETGRPAALAARLRQVETPGRAGV